MTCDFAIGQHLITNPECAKKYSEDNFWIIGQASVLEAAYSKTQNPVLSKNQSSFSGLDSLSK